MTSETVIASGPVSEKLRRLDELMPDLNYATHDFGACLAERLNPEIAPSGFVLAAVTVLGDLASGVPSSPGRSLPGSIVGLPSMMYRAMEQTIPLMADATCPPEFAQEVRDHYRQLQERLRQR